MATNSFLGFSEDGTQLFEMKSKMARQVGDDASDSVKSTIRETLGVPASAEGLTPANNLSDVSSAATSRTNLDVMSIGDITDRANSKAPSNAISITSGSQYLMTSELPGDMNDQVTCHYVVELKSSPSAHLCLGGIVNSLGSGGTSGNAFAQLDTSRRLTVYTTMGTSGTASSNTTLSNIATLDLNRIYVISITVDKAGSGLTAYLDGVSLSSSAISGNLGFLTNPKIQIGQSNSLTQDWTHRGAVVFNRVQSAAEIAEFAKHLRVLPPDQWGNNTEILVDGDMEDAGVTNWSSVTSNATITKATGTPHGGSQCLRVAADSASAAYTEQSLGTFEVGQRIRARGWARGDGTRTPTIRLNGSSWQNIWTGTSSTSWQEFDVTFVVAAGSLARLNLYTSSGSASGEYVEWDDLSWKAVGAVVALLPTPGSINSTTGEWKDSSSNAVDAAPSGGVSALFPQPPQKAHAASDSSADVVEEITAGSTDTVLHRRYGDGAIATIPGYGYTQTITMQLADDAELDLTGVFHAAAVRGQIFFRNSSNNSYGAAILCVNHTSTDPIVIGDVSSSWSTTKDTSSKFNLYRAADGTSKPTIQNKMGYSANITMTVMAHYY